MTAEAAVAAVPAGKPGRPVRARMSRDDIIMRGAMVLLGLFLLVAIVLPLYFMLSKSFETFTYRFETIEFQVDRGDGAGWGETLNALTLGDGLGVITPETMVTSNGGRFQATGVLPGFQLPRAHALPHAQCGQGRRRLHAGGRAGLSRRLGGDRPATISGACRSARRNPAGSTIT